MNFKKINWGLSIIAIISVTTFIWSKTKEVKEDHFKYGKDFNPTRDSLGIPEIKPDWITYESDETFKHWGNPKRGVTTIEPMHLGKTSTFEGEKILTEEDDFHYETDDSLAFRVVYKYTFDNSAWDCKFIRYRKKKYPPTTSWKLTLEQADSVINEWGLSR